MYFVALGLGVIPKHAVKIQVCLSHFVTVSNKRNEQFN